MEAEQSLVQAQIESVQAEIQNLGTSIAELEITIRDLEETVGPTEAMGKKLELAALFQKIGSFRDEENKLRDEENKLRDKKNILLSKQGVYNHPIVANLANLSTDPLLKEIKDLLVQNLLNKNKGEKRKVKSGSQCSKADFDAFGIANLRFNLDTWKDCENSEMLSYVKLEVEKFLQTIAANRKSVTPASKGADVHEGNKSAAKVSGSFQLQQPRPQSISPIPKSSTRNPTWTMAKPSQQPVPSSALFSKSSHQSTRTPAKATVARTGKASSVPNKTSAASRPLDSLSREYERRFVHVASQKLLETLVRFKFPGLVGKEIFVQSKRKYGRVENSASVITGGAMDRAVIFRLEHIQDEGHCLGLWEDKSFLKNVTDLPGISQLCAGVMAEELKFESTIRFPLEVCGVLTNGEKFIIFRRRTGNGQRVNHYFLCTSIEEIAIGLVHFLAVCQENLSILTNRAFNITAGVGKLSVNSIDIGDDDEDEEGKDQQGGPVQGTSESQLKPATAKTSRSSQYGAKRISQKFLREYFDNVPFPKLTAENLARMSVVR